MTDQNQNQKQKPKHEVRFGTVKVAVWEDTSREGRTFHSFDLRRSYNSQETAEGLES